MPLSYYDKGVIYKRTNFMGKAIKCFEKSVKLEAEIADKALLELTKVYMNFKDYDEAYRCIENAVRIKPNYINYYFMIHVLNLKKVLIDDILKIAYETKVDPLMLVDIFYIEGNYEIVLNLIDESLKKNRTSYSIELLKIKSLLKSKRYVKCEDYIDSFPQNYLYSFKIKMYKALCCMLLKDYSLAFRTLDGYDYKKLSIYNRKKLEAYINFYNAINKIEDESIYGNDKDYVSSIFEILDILLQVKELIYFNKMRQFAIEINYKEISLQLAELYLVHGYISEAKEEVVRYLKNEGEVSAKVIKILGKLI
ncbi:hypothetical protein KYB31_01380 [Clostridium felsineum]|uniref:tetratricopeptide repeat protein n=1 Tax=Clostridium felsineum TaxID=36839 RepID=UPI00214DCDC2|nr:hypothetical protein [Clostridium felsineum]MCR3757644.1 hypothetical protein [Clostridium felsineum]